MAEKKAEAKKDFNIENLESLQKEFVTNKMIPRKAEMLKIRLVELWTMKTLFPKEEILLELILKRERAKGNISDAHVEVLNRIEVKKCTEVARCKTADAPQVLYVKKDQLCKFFRQEPIGAELLRFVVFVERDIPPEFQMTRELLLKEERGHHAAESEYPVSKQLLHRLELNEGWFNATFNIEEDLLSETIKEEESYKF